MIKRVSLAIVLVGLLFGGYYGFKIYKAKTIAQYMASLPKLVVTVSSAKAKSTQWRAMMQATGELRAIKAVNLATRASGVISEIIFQSGQAVEQGTILLKIDDTEEQTQLSSARAALGLSLATLKRDKVMLAKALLSQADYDIVKEDVTVKRASLKGIEELISHKVIKAPFPGVLGLRDIEVGDFLSVGSPVVSLQDSDKLRLRFSVPEHRLFDIKVGEGIDFTVITYPEESFRATITAFNNQLSKNSHSMLVEALFDNTDGRLMAGMFTAITIPLGEQVSAPAVPETAISYSLYGNSIFVVNASDKQSAVERRTVKTGLVQDGWVQILNGIKVGDIVVIAGQNKLQNGSSVKINNENLPLQSASRKE